MLLYSLWTTGPGLPNCPLWAHSCLAGFIHHHTSAWHHHCNSVRISFQICIQAPPPPSLQAPHWVRVLLSGVPTAEDHCCCLPPPPVQAATQMLQPMTLWATQQHYSLESGSVSGDKPWRAWGSLRPWLREDETCQIQSWGLSLRAMC